MSTYLKFPDFDNQNNDDYNKDNIQNTQNHGHHLCYSNKRFYKRDD